MAEFSRESIHLLLSRLYADISGSQAHEQVVRIHELDRSSSFSDYNRSSDYCAGGMSEIGLEGVAREAFPADGKTRFGDWMMPVAWDAGEATLEIVSPSIGEGSHLLARRSERPQCLVMWSAPTPPEGVEAEMVLLQKGKEEELRSLDLQGKIVFTPGHPAEIKRFVARGGGIGITSDWMRATDLTDAVQWINTWSDSPGGWAMHAHDSRLFGFTLSKQTGDYLRKLAQQGQKVRLRARVDSRLYEGVLHCVTGVIPGKTDGEVLIMAHINEQGANDNATGVATVLEAARALKRQVADGKLSPPLRTIRFLLLPESYGTMAYAARNLLQLKRTICALNVDGGAGDYDSEDSRLNVVINPLFCRLPSGNCVAADGALAAVAQAFYAASPDRWSLKKYTLSGDNFFGEPLIGVPHPWLWMGDGGEYWHNSEDTPDKVDPRSLRDLITVSAAYLYLMASASHEELERIALETIDTLPDEPRFLLSRPVPSLKEAEPGAMRPRRDLIGALTLDGLPVEEWEVVQSTPRWWSPYLAAWWWSTGEYTLPQIADLIRAELENAPDDLEDFFAFLHRRGYIVWG